jgi:hypothetical protein
VPNYANASQLNRTDRHHIRRACALICTDIISRRYHRIQLSRDVGELSSTTLGNHMVSRVSRTSRVSRVSRLGAN